MDQAAIAQAVTAYRELRPESIDVFRALDDDEVMALKVCLAVTAPPAKKRRSDAGQTRTKKATGA